MIDSIEPHRTLSLILHQLSLPVRSSRTLAAVDDPQLRDQRREQMFPNSCLLKDPNVFITTSSSTNSSSTNSSSASSSLHSSPEQVDTLKLSDTSS